MTLVVTDNFSTWHFRRGLLKAAVERGLDTYLLTPSGAHDEGLQALGIRHIPIKVSRVIDPLRDLVFLRTLYRIFRAEQFDLVHNISIKPNIYGAIAARLAGVQTVVGSVTGIGNLFMDEMGTPIRVIRPIVTLLYRLAFRLTDRVWFQNPDDIDFFVSSRILPREKAILIRSSGVDLDEFSDSALNVGKVEEIRRELNVAPDTVMVSMIARTLWSKGVKEFVGACELLKVRYPYVKFVLVGDGEEGNPISVPHEYMESRQSENFRWLGWRTDTREILAASDIVTLLTRHREGVPKTLLEGMAMGKPVVTTDVPGCREVVEESKNGFLVPPANTQAAAAALEKLISDRGRRSQFGSYSRQKVVREFSQAQVNERILTELYRVH